MYLEHFELSEYPFSLTPNTDFYCNLVGHENAQNTLLYGLKSGEGFIKVTGEVGTGKTLLCRLLLNTLEDPFVTAYIPNPDLTPHMLIKALARELEVDVNTQDSDDLRELINQRLLTLHGQGKQVVLIIDEAQALPDESLEAVRLLTNLETEQDKLLQIVLFGQPELDWRVKQHQFRQLLQRITFSYELTPLAREDVVAYIFHRVAIAGYRKGQLFTPGAVKLLSKYGQGTPRLVNVLCHKAMLLSYGRGEQKVSKRAVQEALKDTCLTVKKPFMKLWVPIFASLAAFTAMMTVHFVR